MAVMIVEGDVMTDLAEAAVTEALTAQVGAQTEGGDQIWVAQEIAIQSPHVMLHPPQPQMLRVPLQLPLLVASKEVSLASSP